MTAGVLFAQGGGPVIPDFGKGDECIRANGNFCLHWFLDNFVDRFWPLAVNTPSATSLRMTEIRPPDVGDVAPDFTLPDATATPRHLADLCAERPQVLIFYRGHW